MAFRKIMLLVFSFLFCAVSSRAQVGNSGSIEGVVKDQSGAGVSNATVEISYPVSGYSRTVTAGPDGSFRFTNVPFNPYHLVVSASGFTSFIQDVDLRFERAGNASDQFENRDGGNQHHGRSKGRRPD